MTLRYKSYYINLLRRKDRDEKMIKEFIKHNFKAERFDAYDGQDIKHGDENLFLFAGNTFEYRRGVMGAALSHINLWKNLVASDNDYFVIFEDDIILDNNFNQEFEKILAVLENNKIPLLLLGYHKSIHYDGNVVDATITTNNNYQGIYKVTKKVNKKLWGGLFGYMIHVEEAARYLLDIYTNMLKIPIDIYIFDKEPYFYDPSIVHSPVMTWDNLTDSDIQYDIVGLYDDFIFFQYLDSPGYDIKWINAPTFDYLKKAAENEPNCVAFNTYAWLKFDICDPSKFIIMPGMNSLAHGIYVKKSKLDQIGYNYK